MTIHLPTPLEISELLGSAPSPSPDDIAAALEATSANVGKSGQWGLLTRIFQIMLHPGSVTEPFGPMFSSARGRSMIPSDLTPEERQALRPLLEVDHVGFRARLGDVLWVSEKNAEAGRSAAIAYKETGSRLENAQHWFEASEQYERGLRLAKQIQKNGPEVRGFLDHLQDRVRSYAPELDLLRRRMLALLYEFHDGDAFSLATIAMETGERLRISNNPASAREAFDLAAKFYHRARRPLDAEAARVASADTFLQEADGFARGMGEFGAHGSIQKAILALQKIPSQRGRIPQLQKRLRSAGRATLGIMQTVGAPFDIKPLVERAEKLLSGITFEEALVRFALITSLIDPFSHRKQVEAVLRESPLHAMFDTTVFDNAGRTTGVAPAAVVGTEEEREKGMRHHMHRHAELQRQIVCGGYIGPILSIIAAEHEFDDSALAAFMGGNPIILEGHETYFIRGIAEGLRGDFALALHFLVPQIESSLRQILYERGIITTDLEGPGIEMEWTLGRVLGRPELAEAIGEDFTYELSDLLLGDNFGSNIRNALAHGLLPYNATNGVSAVYLWWIMLRFVLLSSPLTFAIAEQSERKT